MTDFAQVQNQGWVNPHDPETGQFKSPTAVVEFPARSIPITESTPMTDFNPDDANSVSRFFQGLADKVVLASTLPKEVEELRQAVERLRNDVEAYRADNARMDQEINRLREERVQLQRENAMLRNDLENECHALVDATQHIDKVTQERDQWHQNFITKSEAHETVLRERDDAQMKVLELEDKIKNLENDRDFYKSNATQLADRISTIRSALNV